MLKLNLELIKKAILRKINAVRSLLNHASVGKSALENALIPCLTSLLLKNLE